VTPRGAAPLILLLCLPLLAAAQGSAPQIFAPGVISSAANDGTPAFSPDGRTLFFTRSGPQWGFILESHAQGTGWSQPRLASFSGEFPDSSPSMAPDGSYLLFESLRPADGASAAKHASALWKVERRGSGWGRPQRLPDTVNIGPDVWRPAVAANGDVYFNFRATGVKNFRLYRAHYQSGSYQRAEPLPFSDGSSFDVDAAVAPDQSFVVFASSGRAPFKDTHEHLYIVFAKGAGWGEPWPLCLGGAGDGTQSVEDDAALGVDGRTLYFATDRTAPMALPHSRAAAERALADMQGWNNGTGNVWSVSLAPWLDAVRAGQAPPACPSPAS
jgi:hypothetical protein